MRKVLIIDDDIDICHLLKRFLSKNQFEVDISHSGLSGLKRLNEFKPDVILCDFRLDDMDGYQFLIDSKSVDPTIPILFMTGYSDVRIAVKLMKAGAFDYITKPLIPDDLLAIVSKAISTKSEEAVSPVKEASPEKKPHPGANNKAYKQEKGDKGHYLVPISKQFKTILQQIDLVSPTNYSVIIYGESGSGKESIAKEIHQKSNRAKGPFVAIDCGVLSKELASSELFGHEKGSFTGALSQKTGSFEMANGGTIFLDEIANLPYDVQVTLLRVIQERKMKRVGSNSFVDLDVRILVASNERLNIACAKGQFREDLYHRFNEFSIEIPPLRDRKEDIDYFALHFLEQANGELGRNIQGFTEETLEQMRAYSWPGNLRELNNVVKRSSLLCKEDYIQIQNLPSEMSLPQTNLRTFTPNSNLHSPTDYSFDIKHASADIEFEIIVEAIKKCNYNKSKAAQLLNIDRKTLYNKMKMYKHLNGDI